MRIPCYTIVLFILAGHCSSFTVQDQNRPAGWIHKKADIYFCIDASSSVWILDFTTLLKFVSSLVSDMDIGHSFTRVGVGVFAVDHYIHISLTNSLSKDQLMREILNAKYLIGDAYLSRALRGIREQGLVTSIVRPDVPHIAVLFTDGESRYKQLTADNATLVKKDNILLFTVGIGNRVNLEEMRSIASDPKVNFNFHVPSFDNLNDIRAQLSSSMSKVQMLQRDEGTCGQNIKVDTVFVFDEAAVGEKDTLQIKTFIMDVVKNLSMNSGNARVGVVSKTCHEEDITLGQYITRETLVTALQIKSGPGIPELLKRVRQQSFLTENGARSEAKHRIVLILHAKVTKSIETWREADRAKYADLEIFVIRLGNDYDKSFINTLASKDENTMYPGTADDLNGVESKNTFMSSFCREL